MQSRKLYSNNLFTLQVYVLHYHIRWLPSPLQPLLQYMTSPGFSASDCEVWWIYVQTYKALKKLCIHRYSFLRQIRVSSLAESSVSSVGCLIQHLINLEIGKFPAVNYWVAFGQDKEIRIHGFILFHEEKKNFWYRYFNNTLL